MKLRLALCTFATAGLAMAAEAHFGATGITVFETARLTAYCSDEDVPGPCDVTLEFRDSQGRVLKQSTLTLLAGTGGFLDLAVTQPGIFPSRVGLDPCWKVTRGAALLSFEVFENLTLRTLVLANWADRSVPMSGHAEFGLVGITRSDTQRLNAFCSDDQTIGDVPPGPCDVTFEFHDINGRVVKQSRMTLQPGTSGFSDLRWSETGSTARRVEIEPCWLVAGGAAVGTVETIDNLTGLTTAIVHPAALLAAAR